jgi:hypothetical protein
VTAYYNEIDPYAAQWLRNLIKAGHIAPGDVDERSIVDVRAHELTGYTQCHFFAGIGGWSLALRLAGWPEDWRDLSHTGRAYAAARSRHQPSTVTLAYERGFVSSQVPQLLCGLMGYPVQWVTCGALETPSSPRSRRNLSAPRSKQSEGSND